MNVKHSASSRPACSRSEKTPDSRHTGSCAITSAVTPAFDGPLDVHAHAERAAVQLRHVDLDELLEPRVDARLVGDRADRLGERGERLVDVRGGLRQVHTGQFAHDASLPSARRGGRRTGQNDRVSEPIDEFSFLPGQAADFGIDAPIPRGERLSLTLAGRAHPQRAAVRRRSPGRDVPARRGAERAHVGHDDPRAGAAGARDRPARARRLVVARRCRLHRPACWRPMSRPGSRRGPPGRSCSSGSRSAASPRPRSRHPTPISCANSSIIDITPGVDPNAGPTQIRDFFAGPTDWATRDEMVDRALAFGLGGTRKAAERGVYLNSRERPDGRFEWKHHFAHLSAAMSASPELAATVAAQQDAVSRRPLADRLGRPRRRHRADDCSSAETTATSRTRTPPSSRSGCPRHPSRSSPRATMCRRRSPSTWVRACGRSPGRVNACIAFRVAGA